MKYSDIFKDILLSISFTCYNLLLKIYFYAHLLMRNSSIRGFGVLGFWGLAHWHINYETIAPFELKESVPLLETDDLYRVQKMTFAKKGKEVDKTVIHYNSQITLSGIPPETYEYIVNGKPALEWIMERYAITTDKDSGITNNPQRLERKPPLHSGFSKTYRARQC